MVWTVLGLCGLGVRSCPKTFGWRALAFTACGLLGLFGEVGVVVVLCRVWVTAFGGYRGGVVPSLTGGWWEVAMGTMALCAAVVEEVIGAVWYPPKELRLERWAVWGLWGD